MAKPRAAQFAKDIGVSTNQAKKLIKAFAGEERPKLGRAPILTKEDIRKMQDMELVRDGMRMVPVAKRGKGGVQVRGMGAAYMADPRKVQRPDNFNF